MDCMMCLDPRSFMPAARGDERATKCPLRRSVGRLLGTGLIEKKEGAARRRPLPGKLRPLEGCAFERSEAVPTSVYKLERPEMQALVAGQLDCAAWCCSGAMMELRCEV